MEILLLGFSLNIDLTQKIIKFIDQSISSGYNIDGKDIKGVLGGVLYLFSRTKHLGITQRDIAAQLDITEVTLRRRHKELSNFYTTNAEKFIEKPTKEQTDIKQDYKKKYKATKITDFVFNKQREGKLNG